jgi:hypothetical protein
MYTSRVGCTRISDVEPCRPSGDSPIGPTDREWCNVATPRLRGVMPMSKLAQSVLIGRHLDTSGILKWLFFLFLFLISVSDISASIRQDTLHLEVAASYPEVYKLPKPTGQFPDTTAIQEYLFVWKQSSVNQGFIESNIDTMWCRADTCFAQLHIGPQYKWMALDLSAIEPIALKSTGIQTKNWESVRFDFEAFRKMLAQLVGYYEDRGYPFAEARVVDIAIDSGQVRGRLVLNKNRYIVIEEVVNAGDAKISALFLERYLGLYKGRPYKKSLIADEGPRRLDELPFARQRRDPLIQFKEDQAIVNVFLNKRNASRFDFVLGVLPNSRETGRLLFTGTANIDLQNSLGAGERLALQFQRLRPETQELKVEASYPYLLTLPFGIDGKFNLYTRDSTNRDIIADLGISYNMAGGDYIRGFWSTYQTDVIAINAPQIIRERQLPRVLDVSNSLYGIEMVIRRLDYRFNPRKGWSMLLRAATGTRRIVPNEQINNLQDPNDPSFDFRTLYDDLPLRTFQLRTLTQLAYYQPLSRLTTLLLQLKGGIIHSPGGVLRNEAYRIGGNQILRGFDEESIFSSFYQVATLEYRLITGQNSNIYVFTDWAYVRDESAEQSIQDWPYGLGAGLNFETPVGIFGLSLAVGSQRSNPLDFRAARMHFGYVSLF